jgi:hypothetical protein
MAKAKKKTPKPTRRRKKVTIRRPTEDQVIEFLCFSTAGKVIPRKALVAGFLRGVNAVPSVGRTVEYGKGRWTIDFGDVPEGDYTMTALISDGSAVSHPVSFTVRLPQSQIHLTHPQSTIRITSPAANDHVPAAGFSAQGTRSPQDVPVSGIIMAINPNHDKTGTVDPSVTGANWKIDFAGPIAQDTYTLIVWAPTDSGSDQKKPIFSP